MNRERIFPFVQLDFGFPLGPGDGRFLVRPEPQAPPECVLVLITLGAPRAGRVRSRRGVLVREPDDGPVPISRATLITPEPFPGPPQAEAWLRELRGRGGAAKPTIEAALRLLNRALHAHRAAGADPHARDVHSDQAIATRIGFGRGDALAEGRFAQAWELQRERRRPRRSMEAPQERFAALLGARETVLVCEELALRARADVDAGRLREAALQARVALESLLHELGGELAAGRRARLEDDRPLVGQAANAALLGPLSPELATAVEEAVGRLEAALRAHRLEGGLLET